MKTKKKKEDELEELRAQVSYWKSRAENYLTLYKHLSKHLSNQEKQKK